MFNYIKELFNKKENARIKELESEIEILKAIHDEKVTALEMELEKTSIHTMELEDQIDLSEREELEDDKKTCSCGGTLLPMYEEHPDWITFCRKCDARNENTDMSPIVEPV